MHKLIHSHSLGLSLSTLRSKIRKYGITLPDENDN